MSESESERQDSRLPAILMALVGLLGAEPVLACSVCVGDPTSAISQGAQAGVLVLLGVVGTVLTGMVSLLVFWMRRAANLRALEVAQADAQATDLSNLSSVKG